MKKQDAGAGPQIDSMRLEPLQSSVGKKTGVHNGDDIERIEQSRGNFMDEQRREESASATQTDAPAAKALAGYEAGRGPASDAAAAEKIKGLRVACFMNARYHSTREAFLDTVHRWFMFGVIVSGAAAIVEPLAGLTGWLAAGAAILGALDLTFDLSNRARAHSMMRRRYNELLADAEEGKRGVAESFACLHRYGGDEEPPYLVVIHAAWNAAAEMVYGDGAEKYKLSRFDLLLQHVWRFEGKTFPLEKTGQGRG